MFDLATPGRAAGRPPARRGWWLGPELAAFAALLALAIPYLSIAPGQNVRSEIAGRAASVIEGSSLAEHHDHGHEVAAQDHVVCGVDIFGTEPRDLNRAEDVRTVYGYYFCAVGPTGTAYLDSSRSDGPVVITFGTPPVVQIARHGAGYEDRVRAMMPDEYEGLCFGGLRDDSVAADVRRRFTDAARG